MMIGALEAPPVHCPAVARVLAVANQKGGVAKTTTVHALGVALAELGERVLLVDLDPQACLTYSLGLDSDGLERSLHDVLAGRAAAADVLVKAGDLSVLPSTIDLAGAEVHLMSRTGREHVLARALRPLLPDYDTVLVDCPPSLGILTINGLTAASEALIPLQCETLGHRGVGQLLETINDVRTFTNPSLRVLASWPRCSTPVPAPPGRCSRTSREGTNSPSSARPSPSRSASPRRRGGGARSWSTPPARPGPRPTGRSPGSSTRA